MSVLAARLRRDLVDGQRPGRPPRRGGLRGPARRPVDRRQVVVSLTPEGEALIERFRELNRRQLRELLELLSDDDLAVVERAVRALTRAAEQPPANRPPAQPPPHLDDHRRRRRHGRRPRKGPIVNRLTEFAVRRRSVTLLLAAAVFISGAYAWSNLQQELLPDIEFPIITVIAPYPGSGRRRRHRAGDQADRAGDLAASRG